MHSFITATQWNWLSWMALALLCYKERNIFLYRPHLLSHTQRSAWKFVNLLFKRAYKRHFLHAKMPCSSFETTCTCTMVFLSLFFFFTIPTSALALIQWALKSMFAHSKWRLLHGYALCVCSEQRASGNKIQSLMASLKPKNSCRHQPITTHTHKKRC